MIAGRLLLAGLLAIGLLGTGFAIVGDQARSEPVAVHDASAAAKKPAANIDAQLQARGATTVPRSEMPPKVAAAKRMSKYKCDKTACWCHGAKSCGPMTKLTNCASFRCNPDSGEPSCWCDKK